jgi:hypothetical protein
MARAWAEEMGQNNAWIESIGGDPQEHQHQPVGIEFPELPGSDCVHKFHHGPVVGYSQTWEMLARAVRARDIPCSGHRRNTRGQIVRPDGSPIPRLYIGDPLAAG